jgi:hypothetical protein
MALYVVAIPETLIFSTLAAEVSQTPGPNSRAEGNGQPTVAMVASPAKP